MKPDEMNVSIWVWINYLRYIENLKYRYSVQVENLQKSLYENEIDLYELNEKLEVDKSMIQELREKRNNLKVFESVEIPKDSKETINKKSKSNTAFATIAGFFIFIFLSLFLEKFARYRKKV
jgi:hypothetical protein